MTPCHVRAGPSFVEEHQPVGIEVELALEPVQPAVQDVGTVLLSGARGPFSTRDAVTIKEPPQRADPNRHGAPPQDFQQFLERHVERFGDHRPDEQTTRLDPCRMAICCRVAAGPRASKRYPQQIALDTMTPNRATAARYGTTCRCLLPPTHAYANPMTRLDPSRADCLICKHDESENKPLGNL